MAIYEDGDRFLQWTYCVSEIYLLYSGQEPVRLPNERLVSMNITHDYVNNLFPLFRIELGLELGRYYEIIQNKNDVKIKLRIQKYYHEIGKSDMSLKRDFINDTFDLILNDYDYDKDRRLNEEAEANNFRAVVKDKTNEYDAVNDTYEFFLFKTDTIRASRQNVNNVLQNATVMDGIAYIATESGLTNLLVGKPNHTTSIPELLIPPCTAAQALSFLDTYYGIYKTGTMMYFDFDRNYILPFNESCVAWETGERTETSIVVPDKSGRFSAEMCTLDKKDINTKINYIVSDTSSVSIQNDSITNDFLNGNNIESVNTYSGDINLGISEAIGKNENYSTKELINRTENPYFNKIYTSQSNSMSAVVTAHCAEYDASVIRPNCKYNFIFEDTRIGKEYAGNYKLLYAQHMFLKTGNDFSISTQLKLCCMTPLKKRKVKTVVF